VQIFAVTREWPDLGGDGLAGAVKRASSAYPRLAGNTLVAFEQRSRGLSAAAISHPRSVARPREYRATSGGVTVLFDGLPVDSHGAFVAHDAAALLERWDELPGRLEGVFSALRVDRQSGEVQCLLDVLGMARVYLLRRERAWALSNSVEVLRLVGGLGTPDPLGVSSLLTLGWAAGDRTLLAGIEVLAGGYLHTLGAGHQARPILTPATVVPRSLGPAPPVGALAESMTRTLRAAAEGIGHVSCGLTAGRDSRVVLALALAAGVPVDLFTSGRPEDLDVQVARKLADRVGLDHRVIAPVLPAEHDDWRVQTSRFVSQTDGVASLWDVADWVEHQQPIKRLGVKLWGPGGEIGRAGNIGIGIPFMANMPVLRASWRAQRWVLEQKTNRWGGLVSRDAADETLGYLNTYLAQRRAEGWRPREVLDSYYAFERVKHWVAAGVLRAIEGVDVFAPFVSRDFITYCYALTPGRRYMEAAHHGLLLALAPELGDIEFERPWKPQRPRAAAVDVLGQALRWSAERATARRGDRGRARAATATPFGQAWYEAGAEVHHELCLSFADSPLWDFVDRRRYEQIVALPREQRAPCAEGLSRVLTIFWYFHGRDGGGSRPAV